MIIHKDTDKSTFSVTELTFGGLLAIQKAFHSQVKANETLSPLSESILMAVNKALGGRE